MIKYDEIQLWYATMPERRQNLEIEGSAYMSHLYIIRHGQAISAVERTMGDRGLSPLGIRQAERLRDRLGATGEIAADVLIASTMHRAKETAEIIAPALGLPIEWDDDVQEL